MTLLWLVALISPAQQVVTSPTNLAGRWRLDIKRSTFGLGLTPKSQTYEIRYTSDNVELSSKFVGPEGEIAQTFLMIPDGKRHIASETATSKFFAVAHWEKEALVAEFRQVPKPGAADLESRWVSRFSTSSDGETLTVRKQVFGLGLIRDFQQTLLLVRDQ